MESILPLGCILEKSLTTLRITSEPKERIEAALFSAVVGAASLLVILLIPFSRLSWAGLIILGSFSIAWLLVAFLIGFCRTEIAFDISHGVVTRRRFCLGKVQSTSSLPLDQLKAIRFVKKGRGAGELRLIQRDGKVWTKWVFRVAEVAEETSEEVLAWLEEHSSRSISGKSWLVAPSDQEHYH